MSSAPKRKLWSVESMAAAMDSVLKENKGLREAACLYNIPTETLRRHVSGTVSLHCKPGPATVLTEEEEEKIANYLVQMADMGFGVTREGIMGIAYSIVEKSERSHPFKNGTAGRAWFEGFMRRHPNLTIRSPQPLSYCRALCSNHDILSDFFGKLGALYGRLNLVNRPMQIFNSDETGVSVVYKPGKVVAELGRRNVYSVSAAERGKTHTVVSCVSACGFVLPPMIIYPRKKPVPEHFKKNAYPNTLFSCSESGWVNQDLYIKWFNLFLEAIPSSRPVLLIQDGHSSHMSIELIELAKANDVHLLCLPAHTSHLLQPLDVGVFKSFKHNFNKACKNYMMKHPGRVITVDVLASLVGEAYPLSFTPLNIMSGFKKSGVWPINPGEAIDRRTDPSRALHANTASSSTSESASEVDGSPLFSPEVEALYMKRFQEQSSVVDDPGYIAWRKINHPEVNVSGSFSDVSSSSTSDVMTKQCSSAPNVTGKQCFLAPDVKSASSAPTVLNKNSASEPLNENSASIVTSENSASKTRNATSEKSSVLSEVLVLPQPVSKSRRRVGMNAKAICITEEAVLEGLKMKEKAKVEAEEKKAVLRAERERRKEEKEKKRKDKERVKLASDKVTTKKVDDGTEESDEEAICPVCGVFSKDVDDLWVLCDGCGMWFDFACTKIRSKRRIPEVFYCAKCIGHV